MNYYVVQVKTRGEEKYLSLAGRSTREWAVRLLWPRRNLTIRKQGRNIRSLAPIFPGYLFIEADSLDPELYWSLKRIPGFFRFLRSNDDIIPIEGDDKRLLLHFLSYGEIIDKSKVIFDDNNRIRVLEGPMKGLEGLIVKVDRRKKRAKIRLTMYSEAHLVDLGFEVIEPLGSEGADAGGV